MLNNAVTECRTVHKKMCVVQRVNGIMRQLNRRSDYASAIDVQKHQIVGDFNF